VTTAKTGESLTHLTWKPGDLVIADRGYCRRRQIAHILQARADFIVRWYVHGLPVFTPLGDPFDVAAWLTRLTDSSAETTVSDGASSFRLLACRLSPQAAQRARQKCRRKAQKNGTHVQDATLFFAGWFLLVTSLSSQEATFAQVLDLYRARWQIELLFKRIKQLLQVHRLPSFQQCVNETLVALLLCGWILLEAHHQRLLAMTPEIPTSLWQGQSLLVRTFRCQLFGTWSLSQIITSWSALQRYLRPSRPFGKRWSCESLLSSLETLLASA
jgi:hypothetical protein